MNSFRVFLKLAKYYAFFLSAVIFGFSVVLLVSGFQLTSQNPSQEGQGFGIIGIVFGFIGILISLVFFLFGISLHGGSRKMYVFIVMVLNIIATYFMFWGAMLI